MFSSQAEILSVSLLFGSSGCIPGWQHIPWLMGVLYPAALQQPEEGITGDITWMGSQLHWSEWFPTLRRLWAAARLFLGRSCQVNTHHEGDAGRWESKREGKHTAPAARETPAATSFRWPHTRSGWSSEEGRRSHSSSLKTAHILNPIFFFVHLPPWGLPTCPLSRVFPEHFLPHRLSKGLCVRQGEERRGQGSVVDTARHAVSSMGKQVLGKDSRRPGQPEILSRTKLTQN